MTSTQALIAKDRSDALLDSVESGEICLEAILAFPMDWQMIASECRLAKCRQEGGQMPLPTMNPLATRRQQADRHQEASSPSSSSAVEGTSSKPFSSFDEDSHWFHRRSSSSSWEYGQSAARRASKRYHSEPLPGAESSRDQLRNRMHEFAAAMDDSPSTPSLNNAQSSPVSASTSATAATEPALGLCFGFERSNVHVYGQTDDQSSSQSSAAPSPALSAASTAPSSVHHQELPQLKEEDEEDDADEMRRSIMFWEAEASVPAQRWAQQQQQYRKQQQEQQNDAFYRSFFGDLIQVDA